MKASASTVSIARYTWAAPATLVGLAFASLACVFGATARVRAGVVEVAGGRLVALARGLRFVAITFGHVVLGTSHSVLERERAHEHAHVRQYERWGVFFFPLYVASSAAQLALGRDPYMYNAFERQAFSISARQNAR